MSAPDKKVIDESLSEVAGGTEDECREIYEFFKTHDPELAALTDQDTAYFRINPYYGVSVMVGMKLGIEGFYYCKDRGDKKNVYIDALDNEYTHAEIMAMLRKNTAFNYSHTLLKIRSISTHCELSMSISTEKVRRKP